MTVEIIRFIFIALAAFEFMAVGRCITLEKYFSTVTCFAIGCIYASSAVYG